MKILIILLICLSAFSSELKIKNFNSLETLLAEGSSKIEDNVYPSSSEYVDINAHTSLYYNNFLITSTLNFTYVGDRYSRISSQYLKSVSFIELSELTLNYQINHSVITAGLLTLKEGAYSEFRKIGSSQSDALFTIFYLNMSGAFYTYHYNGNKVQIGYGKKTKQNEKLYKNRYDNSSVDSDIIFIFTKNDFGKHNLRLNFATSNIKHKKITSDQVETLGKLTVAGLGYSFSDMENSGKLFYSIFAISLTNFDGTVLSPNNDEIINNQMVLSDEGDRVGYSVLLGAKKVFDANILKHDSYIGVEYFHASKYWTSYVNDKINFSNYSFANLGNLFKIYSGVTISPDFKIGISYQYQQMDHKKMPGGNSVKSIDEFSKGFCFTTHIRF